MLLHQLIPLSSLISKNRANLNEAEQLIVRCGVASLTAHALSIAQTKAKIRRDLFPESFLSLMRVGEVFLVG